jgi:hypothetical protein
MVSSALKLAPLAKRNMDQRRANAPRLGVPPEEFAKAVVEDYLELQREAASSHLIAQHHEMLDLPGGVRPA